MQGERCGLTHTANDVVSRVPNSAVYWSMHDERCGHSHTARRLSKARVFSGRFEVSCDVSAFTEFSVFEKPCFYRIFE